MTFARLAIQLVLCGLLALGAGQGLGIPPLTLYGFVLLGVGAVGMGIVWSPWRRS